MELTHFDEAGNARMVDVSEKAVTARTAVAEGYISVNADIYERIKAGTMKKRRCFGGGSTGGDYGRQENIGFNPFVSSFDAQQGGCYL